MTHTGNQNLRVLAVDPYDRGFGFAILEGPSIIVDWGLKTAACDRPVETLRKINALIDTYAPERLVLEDCFKSGSRRSVRVQNLLLEIGQLANERMIKTAWLTQKQVRETFLTTDAKTKDTIASHLANEFPQLASKLPRRRRAWMSESRSMHVFDAVALGRAYFTVGVQYRRV